MGPDRPNTSSTESRLDGCGRRNQAALLTADLAGAREMLLERARQLGLSHRAGVDGWCSGCVQEGLLLFHPCSYARWAQRIGQQYQVLAGGGALDVGQDGGL